VQSKPHLALAFGIGLVAGLRTMTPPAALARAARRRPRALRRSKLAFLSSPHATTVLSLLAAGELIADKLPFVPNRTSPPSLVARLISGGLSGAAISLAQKESAAEGALLGASGALAGAFGGFHLRRWVGQKFRIPDLAIAPLEDLLAVGAANAITSRF
jgi:uncharacterized membrane protein